MPPRCAQARIGGDKLDLATNLLSQAYGEIHRGAIQEAIVSYAEASQIASEIGSPKLTIRLLQIGGRLEHAKGDAAGARNMFLTALEMSRAAENGWAEQHALYYLAEAEFALGNCQQAIELARQAVAAEDKGRRPFLGAKWARINLASYLCLEGSTPAAREVAAEILSQSHDEGIIWICVCLLQWAVLGAREGRFEDAASLHGFVEAGLAAAGMVLDETEQLLTQRLQEILQANLSAAQIQACAATGSHWQKAEALEFAIRHLLHRGYQNS